MNILSERYSKICTHKGFDICTLKEANPLNGNSLGYVVDYEYFRGRDYNNPEDAIKVINEYLLNNKDKSQGNQVK